jgi:hypothetical protein
MFFFSKWQVESSNAEKLVIRHVGAQLFFFENFRKIENSCQVTIFLIFIFSFSFVGFLSDSKMQMNGLRDGWLSRDIVNISKKYIQHDKKKRI